MSDQRNVNKLQSDAILASMARDTKKMPTIPPAFTPAHGRPQTPEEIAFAQALAEAIAEGRVPIACYAPEALDDDEEDWPKIH